MALAETAKLVVNLSLAGNFASSIGKAGKQLDKFNTKVDRTETRAYRAGQQIGTGVKNIGRLAAVGVGILVGNVALGLNSLIDLEKATAQTEAVIKSTGGVAGVTAKQVRTLAEEFESMNATVGDEFIQSGENLLLTFTNITDKGFKPALQAALDMNTALGKGPEGLTNTVKVVGKALNDPTKGLGALARVGVTFDKGQTARIKKLQKEGKLYEAQQIILKELEKRFGGSFLAGGNTTAGKVAKFTDSIEDLQRSLATALLPAVGNIADALSDLLKDPEIQKGFEDLGREIGNVLTKDNIKNAAKILGDAFGTVKSALPTIRDGVSTIATVVGQAVDAFNKLPDPIKQLLVGAFAVNKLTGGLVTNIAGGVFGALKNMVVQAGVVNVNGPVAGGGVPGATGGAASLPSIISLLPIAGIVAAATQAVTDEANRQGQNAGITTKVDNPFAGGILGGFTVLPSMLGVLQDLLHVAQHPPVPKDPNGTEHHPGKGSDDLVKPTKEGTKQAIKDAAKQAALVSKVQAAVDKDRAQTVAKVNAAKAAVSKVQSSVDRDRADTVARLNSVKGQTATSGQSIVSAIYANRPIITTNVSVSATNVTKVTNVQKNYGNNHPSRNADPNKSYGGGV